MNEAGHVRLTLSVDAHILCLAGHPRLRNLLLLGHISHLDRSHLIDLFKENGGRGSNVICE
jgi:hypothetical protein